MQSIKEIVDAMVKGYLIRGESRPDYQECYEKINLFEGAEKALYLDKMANVLLELSQHRGNDCFRATEWALFVIDQMEESEQKEKNLEKVFVSSDVMCRYKELGLKIIIDTSKRTSPIFREKFLRHLLNFFKEVPEIDYVQRIYEMLGEELSVSENRTLNLKFLEKKLQSSKEERNIIAPKMKELAILLSDEEKNYWLNIILEYYYSPEIALLLSEDKRDQKMKDYFISSLKKKDYQESSNLIMLSPKSLQMEMAKEMFVNKAANIDKFYGPINNFSVYFQSASFLPEEDYVSFLEEVLVKWYHNRYWWRKFENLVVAPGIQKVEVESVNVEDDNNLSTDDNFGFEDDNDYSSEDEWEDLISADENYVNDYSSYLIALMCANKLPESSCRATWMEMIISNFFKNLDQLDLSFLYKIQEDVLNMEIIGLGNGIELFTYLNEKERSILAEKIIIYCLRSVPYFLTKSGHLKSFVEKVEGDSKKYFEIILSLLQFLGENKTNEYAIKMANLFEIVPSWLLEIHTLNGKINRLIDRLKSLNFLQGSNLTVEEKKSLLEIVGDIILENKQTGEIMDKIEISTNEKDQINSSVIYIEENDPAHRGLKRVNTFLDKMKEGDTIKYSIGGILRVIKKNTERVLSPSFSIYSEKNEELGNYLSKNEVLAPLLIGDWTITDEFYPLAKEQFLSNIRGSFDDGNGLLKLMSDQGISVAYDVSKGTNSEISVILLAWLKAGITDEESKNLSCSMNSCYNHYYRWNSHTMACENYGLNSPRTLFFGKVRQ